MIDNIIRCELLSFFSIFGIQHNIINLWFVINIVVNCFHFSVSLGYNTTSQSVRTSINVLWIAFIFQYLWDTTQLDLGVDNDICRCELLSFFSIFGIQHNTAIKYLAHCIVVNCFHFSVSLGYNTTWRKLLSSLRWLWIAFIFQYLWDTTQLIHFWLSRNHCCELLSFFSIFGIQHNFW